MLNIEVIRGMMNKNLAMGLAKQYSAAPSIFMHRVFLSILQTEILRLTGTLVTMAQGEPNISLTKCKYKVPAGHIGFTCAQVLTLRSPVAGVAPTPFTVRVSGLIDPFEQLCSPLNISVLFVSSELFAVDVPNNNPDTWGGLQNEIRQLLLMKAGKQLERYGRLNKTY